MKRTQYGNKFISHDEIASVTKVLKQKNIFRYNDNKSLCSRAEETIRKFVSSQHCLLTTNCTSALKAALLALKPTPGDVVLVPAITFIATVNSALSCGLIPILIDVDEFGHLSLEKLTEYLQNNPKPFAIIAVHLDGSTCDIMAIKRLCSKEDIFLIEDAAQSFGVKHAEKFAGTYGDFGCFSFQQNKILSTGEGGAIVCNSKKYFAKAAAYADHGCSERVLCLPQWNKQSFFGENYKATDITAAILLEQLKIFEKIVTQLEKEYERYREKFHPQFIIERRPNDIPLSLYLKKSALRKYKLSNTTDWKAWDLQNHPIIKLRLSPYSNGFPWCLNKNLTQPECIMAKFIVNNRISIPIDVKKI